MPLLSIIIPIYNAAKYLRQSLDSVISQSHLDVCEVILINDGSNDNSLVIIKEYASKYSCIKVIDKDNEGVSATRNRGLDIASGEFIYFMDADDLLHPNFMDVIWPELTRSYVDIIVWQFATFYSTPKYCTIKDVEVQNFSNERKDIFNYLMRDGCAVSLCSKAIRRSRIGRIIRLDSSMTYGEDMFFSWKCLLMADSVFYIKFPLYYYRQSGIGATTRFHADLYEHYLCAFEDIIEFIKKQGIATPELLTDVDYHFACRLPSLTNMELKAQYSHKQKLLHLAKVINDEHIQRSLATDSRLSGEIYQLARAKNVSKMLYNAKIEAIKSKLLLPLKHLLK